SHLALTQHPLARGGARRNRQALEWVGGNFPALFGPSERGSRISEGATGHRRSASSYELVERVHCIGPSYPRRRPPEKVRERVPDRANGLRVVALAAMY